MKMLNRALSVLKAFSNLELIIFTLTFGIVKIYGPPLFGDPDVGWHIAAGSYIREFSEIPMYDPWSYTSSGQIWYNLSWLWDVIISYANDYIGLQGLYNLGVLINACVLLLLFKELKNTYKIKYDEPILATLTLSGALLIESVYLRPQLSAYIFIILLMKVMEQYRDRKPILTYLYVSIITIAWVNMHGSFILIWIIGGAYLLEAFLEGDIKNVYVLICTGLMAILASLVNPWGVDVYIGVMRTLDTAIKPYIAEWKPFIFGSQYGASLSVIFIFLGGFVHSVAPMRYKIMGGFALLNALISIRGWQTFAILGAPFLGYLFTALYLKQNPIGLKNFKEYGQGAFGILSVALCIYGMTIEKPLYRDNVPIDEINFVIRNYNGVSLYNEYDSGGHIIFKGMGRVKHFIDGRAGTAFAESTIEKYVNFIKGDEGWEVLYGSFPFEVALVSKKDFSNVRTRDFFDDWHLVFEGDIAKVYAKDPVKLEPVVLRD